MKKVKKYVLSALMIAVMALTLCSCGDVKLEGTYVVYENGGVPVETLLEELKPQGVNLTPEQYLSVTFEANNKAKLTVASSELDGTYEVSGDTVKMNFVNHDFTATVKGNEISWTEDNKTAKLKKK